MLKKIYDKIVFEEAGFFGQIRNLTTKWLEDLEIKNSDADFWKYF